MPTKPNTCASCLRDFQPSDKIVQCTHKECKKRYHRDVICIGGTQPTSEDISSWICPLCLCEAKRGGDNSSTPVRGVYQSPVPNVTFRTKPQQLSLPSSDLQALTNEIKFLREEVTSFKGQMDGITCALNNYNLQLESVIAHLARSDDRIQRLEELHNCETRSLKNQISCLEEQLNIQSQISLRNEVEIMGIPEQQNENLLHLSLIAATKLGADIKECDIDFVQRVGLKRPSGQSLTDNNHISFSRPVVVRLLRRAKRDSFLKAAKTRKSITSVDLGISNNEVSKIYFNERLTKNNRQLFRDCRKLSRTAGFSFCWIKNGSIFLRRREGSPAIHIRTKEDLHEKLGGADGSVTEPKFT